MVLCSKFNFSVEKIDLIVDYARGKTKVMVGHNNYFEGKSVTPALIVCKSNDDQTFHLDLPDSGSWKNLE